MEHWLEQGLTILIYAPIPLAILWVLLGAAFSQAKDEPSDQPTPQDNAALP